MTHAQTTLASILGLTLVAQAALPARRLLVVTTGAGVSCLAASLAGVGTSAQILSEVPWEVIAILVSLGLLSELVGRSHLFGVLAAWAARRTQGDPRAILATFAVGMYVVSGIVNNLTALLLVLPILLVLLKLGGVTQRYVSWTLGTVLVACNLGGAATPIGDFPAILLLGSGSMGFTSYLVHAAPPTVVALALLLLVVRGAVRPERDIEVSPFGRRVSVEVMGAIHRSVRVDRRALAPAAIAFAGMFVAWSVIPPSSGIGPELVAWLGVALALLAAGTAGEDLLRRRVDVEATLFLLSLFVMVAAVRRSGLFAEAGRVITHLPVPPVVQLVAFLVLAAVVTGVFSAGPSMAALLEVARALATSLPGPAVYVGLALSVCAGSSLFLTAATSGPLAQALTERAELRDPSGAPLRFGFVDFLPVGLVGFTVILAVGVATSLALVALHGGA